MDISLQQFEVLVKSPCRYCGEAPEGPGGIDRRDNELGYIQDNCVPSCAVCNYMKGTLTEEEILRIVGKKERRRERQEELFGGKVVILSSEGGFRGE